jgi:hypothetical protein
MMQEALLVMNIRSGCVLGVEKASGKTGSIYTRGDISGSNVERRSRVLYT